MDSKEGYEIIYHFSLDKTGLIINLDVVIPKDKPEIDSIVPVTRGAEWIEREMFDILGIKFKGHPNLTRFLMADDWPKGKYPLRRDQK